MANDPLSHLSNEELMALAKKHSIPTKSISMPEAAYTGAKTAIGSSAGGIQQLFGGELENAARGANITPRGISPLTNILGGLLAGTQMEPTQQWNERLASEAATRQQQYEQAKAAHPKSAIAGNILGSALSTPPLPGLGQASIAAKIASSPLGKYIAGQTIQGTAESALGAGLQYTPEGQSRFATSTAGGLVGGGLSGIFSGILGKFGHGLPTVGTRLSPEELEKNAAAAAGTETNLGRVLNNPIMANVYENIVTKYPLSEGAETAQRTANTIVSRGNELAKEMTGGGALDDIQAGQFLKEEGLDRIIDEAQELKRENYNLWSSTAEEKGVRTQAENFIASGKKNLEQVAKNKYLEYEFDPQVKKDIDFYLSEEGFEHSLNDANIFKSLLNEKADIARMQGKSKVAGIYSDLAKSLEEDIKIANNKSPELTEMFNTAQKHYKENIAPLLAPEILAFTNQKKDVDLLVDTFFKTTPGKDRNILFSKLMDVIDKSPKSQELRDVFRNAVFSRAKDEAGSYNPMRMSTIYKNIGPNMKETLFRDNPEMIGKLDEFKRLTGMNEKALNMMFNPPTGQQAMSALPIGTAMAGAAKGYAMGGIPGAIMGGMAGLGAGWGPQATKYLTSEKTRDELIKKILASQDPTLLRILSSELSRGAARGMATSTTRPELLNIEINKYREKK